MAGRGLARSAGLTGAATLASRLLGLARDQVLAAVFGAGNQMDAFVVAFRVPNLVRDLFAEGALSAAFVPAFTRRLATHGRVDAWRLGNSILNTLALTTGVLVVAGIVFAEPIVTLLAGDFAEVPGKLELTISLTRIVLPFLMLAALAAAVMGMLNSLHYYFVPALAPATFNVATIVAAVIGVPLVAQFGEPAIMAIALAALAGGALQIALQWPSLRGEGFRYAPVIDTSHPELRRVLLLMGPGALGLAATQLNLFINTLLATSLGTGAVSWLSYAFRLMYLPIGLFGVSIATAVLPLAASHAVQDDRPAIRATLSRGLGLMLMLNVPASVGLIVLATPIVRVLFERGAFGSIDTAGTAVAVQMYAVGLVGYATARIASPVFYALGKSRVPVAISIAAVLINTVASVALVRLIGFRGLPLGTAIGALAHGGLALWLLRSQLGGIDGSSLLWRFLRIAIAAAIMGGVAIAIDSSLPTLFPGDALLVQILRLTVSIAGALAALAGAATLLRVPELGEAIAMLQARARGTSSA
ncbi:MAG: murein biosynthesis integral membrane protein MurJ [Vicinamibacterales bacterium]